MVEKFSSNKQLQVDIDHLKDPQPYKEKYETQEVQQLMQAIDILDTLQLSQFEAASHIGYNKLRNAKMHLDELLAKQFDAPKEEKNRVATRFFS